VLREVSAIQYRIDIDILQYMYISEYCALGSALGEGQGAPLSVPQAALVLREVITIQHRMYTYIL